MSKSSKKFSKKAAAAPASAQPAAAKAAPNAPPPESAKDEFTTANGKNPAKPGAAPTPQTSKTTAKSAPQTPETAAKDAAADPLAGYDAETLRNLYIRAVAEKVNTSKRAEIEIKKAHDFALARFAPGICEVRDCVESALSESEKAGENDKAREGISLTLRKLSAVMEANGILPVRPDIGASFDPALHEAVGIDSTATHAANTVAAVVQCGYTLNGRVVRAAGIMVSKPAQKSGDKN